MSCSTSAKKAKTATETGPNSAAAIGYNEDLLIQILLRLPARSLIKFKVVSKQWMSLISSNTFCLAHTRSLLTRGPLKPSALFLGDYHFPTSGFRLFPMTHYFVRLPPMDFTCAPNITLLQSCNGLLLCVSRDSAGLESHFICNPITRKLKMLSIPRHRDYPLVGVSLAFDPLKSPHHKIVTVWRRRFYKIKYVIGVHSSETDSWSYLKKAWNGAMKFDHGVFFKGAVYWDSISRDLKLPYFDVENECLKTMPIPQVDHLRPNRFQWLGESGGYLNLTVALGYPVNDLCIFEMMEDHSGWCLKHRLNYDISSQKYFSRPFQVFCAVRSEEGDTIVIVWADGRAKSINFKDCTIKELSCNSENYSYQLYDRFGGCQYTETLSPIL